MNDFQKKLIDTLNIYERTGNLEETINLLNLPPEQIEKIRETFSYLDIIEENARSLEAYKEEGNSRQQWLTKGIAETASEKGLTPLQTENLVEAISESANKIFKSRIKESEL